MTRARRSRRQYHDNKILTTTLLATAAAAAVLVASSSCHGANGFLIPLSSSPSRSTTSSTLQVAFHHHHATLKSDQETDLLITDNQEEEVGLGGGKNEVDNNRKQHQQGQRNFRFASPLLEFGYPPAVEEYLQQSQTTTQKPLLLYIPGFDGTYLSAFFQYPELHSIFEVLCLVTAMDDRSTFDQIKNTVVEFLSNETLESTSRNVNGESDDTMTTPTEDTTTTTQPKSTLLSGLFGSIQNRNGKQQQSSQSRNNKRPVYLAGESFGGIMALEVAMALAQQQQDSIDLQGLVLINAATCYDRSRLAAEGPSVAALPPLLYTFGLMRMLPMFLDDISAPQFLSIIKGEALPSLIDNETREAYMGRLAFALANMLQYMPQETLDWRLTQWLDVGCRRVEESLLEAAATSSSSLQQLRTLIIAGEKDLTLPSIAEAERLAQLLPNSRVHVVPHVGHANTCGTCLDLAAEMRQWFSLAKQGRTAMKPHAANGTGVAYGMEPRYDGQTIGLSPLKYWSKEYYRPVKGHSPTT